MIRPYLKALAAAFATLAFAWLPAAAGAAQAPSAAASAEEILVCGLGAFGEADDRLFGESYAAFLAKRLDRAPAERQRVNARLEAQLELCRERHALSAEDLESVRLFSMNEVLRRGAAWHLRDSGIERAPLEEIAGGLTMMDVADFRSPGYRDRVKPRLKKAGIPSRFHEAAGHYIAFVRGGRFLRESWLARRH